MHLDAANVKSYPGSGTVWKDLSGLGNDGSLINTPTYSTGTSGTFTFAAADIDYVSCGTSVFNIPAPWTMSGWMKRSIDDAAIKSLVGNSGTSPAGSGAFLGTCGGSIPYRMWAIVYNSAGNQHQIYGTTQTLNNVWYYYVMTHDGTTVSLYLNGNLEASQPVDGFLQTNSVLTLGLERGAYWPLEGDISCAHLYNKALSPVEIKQNFEAHRGRYGI